MLHQEEILAPGGASHAPDPAAPDAACATAMKLQLGGRLDLAAPLYRSILDTHPDHAVANHCFGMLQVQCRHPAEGLPFLVAALNASPDNRDYWIGYIEALIQTGQIDAAQETLALGRQYGLAGKAVEDLVARFAITARPSRAPLEDSHALERETTALTTLIAQQRHAEALDLARALTGRYPDDGLSWKRLGALLWWHGRADEAFIPMQHSVRLLPRDAEAHSNFGVLLHMRKRRDAACEHLRRAIEIEPRFAAAHYHLGILQLEESQFADAEASLRVAVDLRPDYLTAQVKPVHSDLLFLTSHNPSAGADYLFAEHRRFGELLETSLRGSWPRHPRGADPQRRLKIGFVSGDFQDHSVAVFFEPVAARLAQRPDLELHAYYNHVAEDAVTARLRGHLRHWNAVAALSDVDLARCIMDDGIDILVDLSGHTSQNRLRTFARKPAPLQVSWLGYPGTTGLRAMDYYLADRLWLPPGQCAHLFTEKLAYLPDRWAFEPHRGAPAVNALPARETGHLAFASFHRLGKINAPTLQMWSQLLHALPQSTLLLAGIEDGQRTALRARFAAQGIAAERIRFHGRCAMDRYLGLHHQVDIALDAHPYSGATTTLHSLSMGVPTLTIAGCTLAARACAGILTHVNLESFVAADGADFVKKGVYWANHLAELAHIRAGLRTRLKRSPGGQPNLIAAHLEGALRHMWRRFCAGLPPESFHSTAASHGAAPSLNAIEEIFP